MQMHFHCIIFNFILPNVLKTSYKGPKEASGGRRSREVPRTSILDISRKCISVVIFSVLIHQMCVLDTKKLVITYSSSFGETSSCQSDTCSVTSLGRPQDVNLTICHKIGY